MSPMSPKEKIAKLEGLLARVRERAESPRPTGAVPFRAPPEDVVQPAAHVAPSPPLAPTQALHAEETFAPVPATRVEPVDVFPSLPPDLSSGWSDPPPEPSGELALEASHGSEMDVEVSAELVEVEIDIDEPGMMPEVANVAAEVANVAAEVASAADEVASAAAEPEPELSSLAPEGSAPPPTLEVEPEPEPEPVVPANELVEPAPSSSPRPIVSVQPEAYENESAPRHTPPPESGKQVAVPSAKPEPVSGLSSIPPASIEDHTLIGGWREPGMAIPRGVSVDFARPIAVRVPAPPPPGEALVPQARGGLTEPSGPEPVGITPEVTKGELPVSARVATFEGAVPRFVPSTFGDLLDATLAL